MSAAFTVVAVTASGPLEIKLGSSGVTISASLDIDTTLLDVAVILAAPTPAVVAPAGSADGSISVTTEKYFVEVAVPEFTPVTVSVRLLPATSLPVITKVLSESSAAEVIVTCRPAPLSKLPAPVVKVKSAPPVTVALADTDAALAVPCEET